MVTLDRPVESAFFYCQLKRFKSVSEYISRPPSTLSFFSCHNATSGAFRHRNKAILGWILSKTLVFTFFRLSVRGSSDRFLKTFILSCLIILISFAKNPYHVVKLWLNCPQVTGLENVTVAFFAWVQELSKLVHFSI